MRVSSQNARVGGGRHNDRNFDISKSLHIDKSKIKDNVQLSWRGKFTEGFEKDELTYYENTFADALRVDNEKSIKQGHKERVRQMKDFISARKSKPEESIYQIGDKDSHVEREILLDCYSEFLGFQSDWNRQHGEPFKILNFALHADEATPHIHQRRVWQYHDEDGIMRVGQEKALKEAGVELPFRDKPEGRFNNRKMSFDSMMREKWMDIIEAHGIEIEREPIPDGRKHQDKEDFIRAKNEELIKENNLLVQKKEILLEIIKSMETDAVDVAHEIIDSIELQSYEERIR